ncbi:MAG: LytTR family transcriptional regulator DNA-binding domain-containing protein [Gemmatimonadaceae bacterium]
MVAKSLAKLSDDVLDPDVFVRVHKSSVVNVQKIEKLKPNDH